MTRTLCALIPAYSRWTPVITLSLAAIAINRVERVSGSEIWAVVGGSAQLPCNMTPPDLDDRLYLVLWYKNNHPQPVYSYDARGVTNKHWSEDRQFGARTDFRTNVAPAQLIISPVVTQDGGEFKCRVDFRNSPTRTSTVLLHVVEQPNKPLVLDLDGTQVMGTVGPYRLDDDLILVCLAEGGDPLPQVTWTRDGQVWDNQQDAVASTEKHQRNTLVISPLDRSHAGATFRCNAANNNVTQPPSTLIKVNIHMPVLDIRLVNLPDPVTAGVEYRVLCQVTGADPPPSLAWRLGPPGGPFSPLPSAKPSLSHAQNLSTSQLLLTPSRPDHGKVLTCSADNSEFPVVEVAQELVVHHAPAVLVDVVGGLDPGRLVEGMDVTLRCSVEARPPVFRINWLRNGTELGLGEDLLDLNNVTRKDSGSYTCAAENVEGQAEAAPVRVVVQYKPYCLAPAVSSHGGDTPGIDLRCSVEARPSASLYRWLFNSSQGSFQIPSAKSRMSFVNYAVSEGGERGSVLCWARNQVGEQVQPCVFHVVPLGPPHPPNDCLISNQTSTTVQVTCVAGFNGGLAQHFVLEVFQMVNNSQSLVTTNWSRLPVLQVSDLTPNTSYILAVHAVNAQGESPAVFVGGRTSTWLPHLPPTPASRLPLLYTIVAILTAVMLLSLVLSITVSCRRRCLRKVAGEDKADGDRREEEENPPAMPLLPLLRRSSDRKVSFIDCKCGQHAHTAHGQVRASEALKLQLSSNGTLNGTRKDSKCLPVEKTVVRSYSIDKLRPKCPTCNPQGNLPYPPMDTETNSQDTEDTNSIVSNKHGGDTNSIVSNKDGGDINSLVSNKDGGDTMALPGIKHSGEKNSLVSTSLTTNANTVTRTKLAGNTHTAVGTKSAMDTNSPGRTNSQVGTKNSRNTSESLVQGKSNSPTIPDMVNSPTKPDRVIDSRLETSNTIPVRVSPMISCPLDDRGESRYNNSQLQSTVKSQNGASPGQAKGSITSTKVDKKINLNVIPADQNVKIAAPCNTNVTSSSENYKPQDTKREHKAVSPLAQSQDLSPSTQSPAVSLSKQNCPSDSLRSKRSNNNSLVSSSGIASDAILSNLNKFGSVSVTLTNMNNPTTSNAKQSPKFTYFDKK